MKASRTLVKSAPELWAECSEAASLARHLGSFGEIRITRLEPETAVAWEGDAASGTVALEPAGWGTRVTLTASAEAAGAAATGDAHRPADERAPGAVGEPRHGPLARLVSLILRRSEPRPGRIAESREPVGPTPDTSAPSALTAALDSLGRAHHRPYSRA